MQRKAGGTRRDFLRAALGGAAVPAAARRQPPSGSARSARLALATPAAGQAVIACAGDWFLTRAIPAAGGEPAHGVFDLFRAAGAGFVNLENGLSTVGSGDLGGFRYGDALRSHPSLASQ